MLELDWPIYEADCLLIGIGTYMVCLTGMQLVNRWEHLVHGLCWLLHTITLFE